MYHSLAPCRHLGLYTLGRAGNVSIWIIRKGQRSEYPSGVTLHDLHGPRYAFSVKLELVGVYFFYFFYYVQLSRRIDHCKKNSHHNIGVV